MEVESIASQAGKDSATCIECGNTLEDSRPFEEGKESENKTLLSWIGGPNGNILPSGKTIYVKAQIVS
jgi:hypothetical protein